MYVNTLSWECSMLMALGYSTWSIVRVLLGTEVYYDIFTKTKIHNHFILHWTSSKTSPVEEINSRCTEVMVTWLCCTLVDWWFSKPKTSSWYRLQEANLHAPLFLSILSLTPLHVSKWNSGTQPLTFTPADILCSAHVQWLKAFRNLTSNCSF